MKLNPKNQINLIIATMVMLLLIGLGWWAGNRRAASKDAEMREHLLQRTMEVADAINPELVKKLTFTAADKGTPAFEQLRKQMLAASKGLRFSVIMQIYFPLNTGFLSLNPT